MPTNTNDDDDDNMNAPVTRRDLREVLASEFAKFEKRFEARLEQKFDIKLGLWGGALMEEIRSIREQARLDKEETRAQARLDKEEILAELARHTRASAERARADLRIVDDQYKTLPLRVEKLEARVFGPPPPAPKRAKRKGR